MRGVWDWIGQLETLRRDGRPVAVVTVVACSGSTPREVGAKMLVDAERFHGTIGGGQLEQLVLRDAREVLRLGSPKVIRYPLAAKAGQCCGGAMDVLVETVNTGPTLFLFGAGHVAQALCQVLQGTPFRIELVDERSEWLNAPGLPGTLTRHEDSGEGFIDTARFDAERSYAAVMTHRHDLDQELIAALVRKPLRYLGLIGSRAKWQRFRDRLTDRGFSAAELDRVRCPIGLPVGGKAPQEVAISIAAELLKTLHGGAKWAADRGE